MKTFVFALAALLSVALVAGNAFAWTCPKLAKEANDAIAKAEPMAGAATEERQKARNMAMIQVANDLVKAGLADHEGGRHAPGEAKAKAAKFLAEQVK